MFDTMTFTKTLGALCGSLLVFLLGSWAAESLYHTGGHGAEEQAYVIDTGEEAVADTEVAAGPSFAELYAAADPSKGERVFNQCKACHKLEDGANAVGPYLHGVVGRDIGSAQGFAYSGALAGLDGNWTPDRLDGFLTKPAEYAPGTKMAFAGLKSAEDRANLIAYLSTQGGTFDPSAVQAPGAAPAAPEPVAPVQSKDEASAPAAAPEAAPVAEARAVAPAPIPAPIPAPAPAPDVEGSAAPAAPAAEPRPAAASATTAVVAGDAAAGQQGFRVCMACHKIEEGKNAVGPSLYKVVGRDIGSVGGFGYSTAMKEQEGNWTVERLDAFLANPKAAVPGTKMPFAGISDAAKRADIIAYLATIGN